MKSSIPCLHYHCFVNLIGPLFVTVPNSPLEVMSVVPINEVPFTCPWNVISIDPPNGNWFWPENVTASFETTPEEIGI